MAAIYVALVVAYPLATTSALALGYSDYDKTPAETLAGLRPMIPAMLTVMPLLAAAITFPSFLVWAVLHRLRLHFAIMAAAIGGLNGGLLLLSRAWAWPGLAFPFTGVCCGLLAWWIAYGRQRMLPEPVIEPLSAI
ncbi:hypothetical protein ASD79_21865 [Caulobacter sp. Root655]|uniref:hypothetical protein n=1 Tax=Caulobacter sp. Root655 TaxID=1736578 RepID=UPI0006F7632F|nr:hypothetical protein [Caulobacter sp. Root655]KRA63937.1 hypothetical protein ASD79_21865 [Caulobacter sp. Root655]